MGWDGFVGKTPVQAARESMAGSGVRWGVADGKDFRSSPAAANNGAGSGCPVGAGDVSSSGGTAEKLSRRPVRSSVMYAMPEISAGGSFAEMRPRLVKWWGSSGSGVSREGKKKRGGWRGGA